MSCRGDSAAAERADSLLSEVRVMSRSRQLGPLPVHLLSILLIAAAPAAAQQPAAPAPARPATGAGAAPSGGPTGKGEQPTAVKYIEFDHLNTDGDRAYVLKLSDGETFQVKILNTCPTVFSYEVRGI